VSLQDCEGKDILCFYLVQSVLNRKETESWFRVGVHFVASNWNMSIRVSHVNITQQSNKKVTVKLSLCLTKYRTMKTLDRRLGGPQSRSGRGGEEKNSQPPPEIEP
jgi:hypothetical protein